MRLHTLLIVPFVLQVVGITGLVGYLSYRSGRDAVQDLVNQMMDQAAYRVRDRLDDYLGTAQQAIARNRQNLESRRIDASDLDALENYFFDVLRLHDRFVTLGYGSTTGESLLVAWDRDLVTATDSGYIVAETRNPQSQENLTFRLDEQGQRLELIQTVQNYDPRQIIWYRTAVNRGGPGWTPIYPLVLKPITSTLAVTPVYQQNQLQGVLFATVPMDEISNFLAELDFSPNGQVFIMERSGDLVATSTREPAYTVNGSPNQREMKRVNASTSEHSLIRMAAQALFDQYPTLDTLQQTQFNFVDTVPLAGKYQRRQRHFATVVPYQDERGLDWLIVTVVPKSDFTAEIYANVRRTVGLCVMALVGAIALSVWLARRITRPILDLEQATQAFVRGRWHPPPQPTRIREIASLQRTFRQMVTEIREAGLLRQNYQEELEQQVAEQTLALQKSTAQLKAAQRIAKVGSWEFDVATGKVTWSEELFHIAGLDPAQFEPSYPEDFALIHPDDRDQIRLAADAAIAHGTPYEVEHRVVRPDGTIRHLVSRGEAVLNLHGEVIKLVGTANDISDRKLAEALIRESEARYRGVVEDQTEFICRFQPDGTLTFVNSSYCRYFGRLEAELLGFNLLDLVPDTDRQEVAQLLADLRSLTPEDPTVTQEHSALTVDGQVVWQQWTNRAIFDATGQLVEFQAVGRDITERRRAEEALKQSQAQLQLITDSVHGCISYVDSSRRYRFVNHAYESWFGCQRADVLGRTVAEVIGTEAYGRAQRHIERVFAGETVAYEAEMPYQTGGTRYISAVLVPDINDQGETLGYYALIVDISDRKRAEMAVEQTNRQLQAFLDNAPAAIAMFDMDGRYYRVNRQFTELFQLGTSAIVGQTFDTLFSQATADLFRTRVQQLAATRQPLEIEDEVVIRGDRRTFRSILFPVVNFSDIEETPQRFWTIALDITERKRIEMALQESERKFATVFHANPTPSWISTLTDGLILEVNEGFSQFYDALAADLMGKTCRDLRLWDNPQDYQTFQHILKTGGRVQGFEAVLRTRSREPRTVLISASVNWINDREYIVGVLSDISDRKRAELQIQQALKEKEILLQEVHHRVKNNLQLIQSLLRMQQRRLKNPAVAQILQESCNRVMAIGLVHELLYQSNNLARIDLADYIPAIVQHVIASSRSIGLPITVNTQIQPVIVPMKKAICCGLILNELVTNAVKYAFPDGQEGQINIDLSVIANSQWDVISLVVRDNGVGLPADLDLAELSSLGLTLVQDFVAQLQGSLRVALVQETQFSITFRIKHHDAASPQ